MGLLFDDFEIFQTQNLCVIKANTARLVTGWYNIIQSLLASVQAALDSGAEVMTVSLRFWLYTYMSRLATLSLFRDWTLEVSI